MKSFAKNILGRNRIGVYILAFIVILGLLTLVTNFWKSLDFYVYKTIYLDSSEEMTLHPDIKIIDLPYMAENKSRFNLEDFRGRLSDLLVAIDSTVDIANKPEAIVLDIYFAVEEENDTVGLSRLVDIIKELRSKSIDVYAVYNMDFDDNRTFESHDQLQAEQLYDELTGFRLHNIIDEMWSVLSYESALTLPYENDDLRYITALPLQVAYNINPVGDDPDLDSEIKTYVLPIGTEEQLRDETIVYTHQNSESSGTTFSSGFKMNDKILIVGSFEGDETKPDVGAPQIGTYLLAWALSDQLNGMNSAKQPLQHIGFILGMVVFFAFFVVLIFALIYKYIRALQTKPILIALLSLISGTLLLIVFSNSILAFSGKVVPVGLTVLGMFVASVLAWHFCKKFLVMGIVEGGEVYDVFISYSHGNSDWVVKNVYEPLSEFKRPDGSKLKIFFDKKSIGIGEAFTVKYMKAIADSKLFVPIMSEEYYNKNHCKNEMDLAVKRYVEKLIKLFPIAFNHGCVPEHYNHLVYTDISSEGNFMEALKNEFK